MNNIIKKALAMLALLTSTTVSAHVTEISWVCESDGSITIYAGTYHRHSTPRGGVLIDGVPYTFTTMQTSKPGVVDGQYIAPTFRGVNTHWMVVNVSGISDGPHSVSTTCTSALECPWPGAFPVMLDFGCIVDSDGDGIPDDQDACPNSDLSPTVIIDGCDSAVVNTWFEDGCTISDLLQLCATAAKNHGDYVRCVSKLTNALKKDGDISGKDKGAIQSCAAKSSIGK